MKEVDSVLAHVRDVLKEKERMYGKANLHKFGSTGIIIRMSDKLSRIENIVLNQRSSTPDETLTDTLIDLIGYTIQLLRLI